MKIFKYKLEFMARQNVVLPETHKILSIQSQNNEIVIWALVDDNSDNTMIIIDIFLTGEKIQTAAREYLSTVQCGDMVYHLFKYLA